MEAPSPRLRTLTAAETRASLLDVAVRQFGERGYRRTSLDDIVAAAGLTKGALYHHFASKAALFAAVFLATEQAAADRVVAASREMSSPWEQAHSGVLAFLDAVREPGYRQIVLRDGPSVLAQDPILAPENRPTFPVVASIAESIVRLEGSPVDTAALATLARFFFGGMAIAGQGVTEAEDPDAEAARVAATAGFFIAGARSLLEQGQAPTPTQG